MRDEQYGECVAATNTYDVLIGMTKNNMGEKIGCKWLAAADAQLLSLKSYMTPKSAAFSWAHTVKALSKSL